MIRAAAGMTAEDEETKDIDAALWQAKIPPLVARLVNDDAARAIPTTNSISSVVSSVSFI
jgi:hypothetical protein